MTDGRLFPEGSRVDDLDLSGVHLHGANLEGARLTDAVPLRRRHLRRHRRPTSQRRRDRAAGPGRTRSPLPRAGEASGHRCRGFARRLVDARRASGPATTERASRLPRGPSDAEGGRGVELRRDAPPPRLRDRLLALSCHPALLGTPTIRGVSRGRASSRNGRGSSGVDTSAPRRASAEVLPVRLDHQQAVRATLRASPTRAHRGSHRPR